MKEKIIKNLKSGNYRIERREHCDCTFDWSIENGELVCDTDVYECWIETVWFIMDDLAGQRDETLGVFSCGIIASYDAVCGLTMLLRKASFDVEQELVNAIKDSDTYKQLLADIYSSNPKNDLHEKRKRESLVKWLEKEKKNKFEHLMTEQHKEELEKEGVVRITELSMTPPQREIHVATISHYVQIRIPYFVYKKITQSLGYKDRLEIYAYDPNDKTVEITALKPILRNELIVKHGYDLIDEYFTYEV